MTNQLEQLKTMTKVVADTGDFTALEAFSPEDATTNPSLILKAMALPEYQETIQEAVDYAKSKANDPQKRLVEASDYLSVLIGCKLLSLVPGRVSTEVDARLSYDVTATVEKARKIIALYDAKGFTKSRILIKIASTWEGIKAAEILEKEGINCNLTLLFSFAQARAAAEAGVFLISPFVGRILDWFKKSTGKQDYTSEDDPGVESVSKIFDYYKQHQYSTIVMGASFRNIGEITALAGCDRLTISPDLMAELTQIEGTLERKLFEPEQILDRPIVMTEQKFRWQMNEDAMATEKTAEGIRNFAKDQVKFEQILVNRLG
ncbi:MAG: transaldolase [Kangiellaceae bacterium]|nr:transaldolase [Kangiellaceae bacterium]